MIDLKAYRTPDNLGEIKRRAEVARAAYLKLLFKGLTTYFSGTRARRNSARLHAVKA